MDVAKLPHVVSWLHFERCENRTIRTNEDDERTQG
jgi:hypothetical protein